MSSSVFCLPRPRTHPQRDVMSSSRGYLLHAPLGGASSARSPAGRRGQSLGRRGPSPASGRLGGLATLSNRAHYFISPVTVSAAYSPPLSAPFRPAAAPRRRPSPALAAAASPAGAPEPDAIAAARAALSASWEDAPTDPAAANPADSPEPDVPPLSGEELGALVRSKFGAAFDVRLVRRGGASGGVFLHVMAREGRRGRGSRGGPTRARRRAAPARPRPALHPPPPFSAPRVRPPVEAPGPGDLRSDPRRVRREPRGHRGRARALGGGRTREKRAGRVDGQGAGGGAGGGEAGVGASPGDEEAGGRAVLVVSGEVGGPWKPPVPPVPSPSPPSFSPSPSVPSSPVSLSLSLSLSSPQLLSSLSKASPGPKTASMPPGLAPSR